MAKTKKPEQAIFYQNFKGAIYGGTPEQVKNLMTAFCQYAFDNVENPTVAPDIAMTFGMMKVSVDADRRHYQEVCDHNLFLDEEHIQLRQQCISAFLRQNGTLLRL